MAPTIGILSLGCPKAQVDSERLLTALAQRGYEFTSDMGAADGIVVTTCGFLETAVAESLEAIGEAVAEKVPVFVTGCLGALPERVRTEFPDLAALTGPAATEETVRAITRRLPPPGAKVAIAPEGMRLSPPHYAYLKIAEGCDAGCTYCVIPQLRGPQKSRPFAEIMAEAETLVAAGKKELIVVAQDTGAYGRALGGGSPGLLELVDALGDLGIWVRLHYVYPYPRVVEALLERMQAGRLLPYLDVPLQHARPRVLKAMRRPGVKGDLRAQVARWREKCPGVTLRSTFIVGFPGETTADFDALLDFLEAARLERVGAFPFEAMAGTAAAEMSDQVPEEDKLARWHALMQLQQEISRDVLAERVGTMQPVLIDEGAEAGGVGRTPGDAPEIDGVVHVSAERPLAPGEMVSVEITGSDEYDLWGRMR